MKRTFWTRALLSEYLVLYVSAVYFLALAPVVPGFASAGNLANIFSSMLPLLVAAVGQTIVLIAGGIDLSVTSIIALSSVTGGLLMTSDGGPLGGSAWAAPAGVAVMLAAGMLVGLLNGASIGRFGMPPFIVTLISMMFFSGLAIRMTKSQSVYHLPRQFNDIGGASWLLVPNALLVALAVALAAHIALSRSVMGRWLYAIGGNVKAALVCGVPVRRAVIAAYAASGVCAAAASILYTGRLETSSPVLGQRIFLDVIGAAVIGGNSLFGGKGKIAWTAMGVLFITLIDNSLNLMGLSNFTILLAKGGVILAAALLDSVRLRLAERA